MSIISFFNQAGGTGKTTLAMNLGYSLAGELKSGFEDAQEQMAESRIDRLLKYSS